MMLSASSMSIKFSSENTRGECDSVSRVTSTPNKNKKNARKGRGKAYNLSTVLEQSPDNWLKTSKTQQGMR